LAGLYRPYRLEGFITAGRSMGVLSMAIFTNSWTLLRILCRCHMFDIVLIVKELQICCATYIFWVKVTRYMCSISGAETIGQFTGTCVTFLGQVSWWLCARCRGYAVCI